ncbi:hypothetical protein [Aureivirga marina]|uniref:hypothetical protein n=1 Tax=Aureivirga marina TaxID=1182451 RepID=UPI001E3D116D|nr:hypothetical protein [Aureivirga marina]
MKYFFYIIFLFFCQITFAQIDTLQHYSTKHISLQKKEIKVDSVSINPVYFEVFNAKNQKIDTSAYNIDFQTATLTFKTDSIPKNIKVVYKKYPSFLTRKYAKFDKKYITNSSFQETQRYVLKPRKLKSTFKPFDGLNTNGSISRGITVGNNQDAVVNSNLDLQISGKLSEKLTLRASISDSNIPLQENGYTQQVNEFDRVFIELFTDNWKIKAGDVDLQNRESKFLNFSKKVSGISVDGIINGKRSETDFMVSGAVVKGQFTSYKFDGIEGNQGPYKLAGNFNETNLIIVAGSEKIYVNGRLLKRGENNDYVIDYNTAELTFTATYPITSSMRITAEYQYSDRNYTRFVTYNKVGHKRKDFSIQTYFYHEADAKNQPLQQNLTEEQKEILANAGNNTSEVFAPSAVPEAFSENKILYKKVLAGSEEIFEFSDNPEDELFRVTFTYIGNNQGSYAIESTIGIGKIYEYVGENQGDYLPVVRLIAPTKLQIVGVQSAINPTEKTAIQTELTFSNNDQNLFSDLDKNLDQGYAGDFNIKQTIFSKKYKLDVIGKFLHISENFKTIERFQSVEFNRDWNIPLIQGKQQMITGVLDFYNEKNKLQFTSEFLNFGTDYKGNKQSILGIINTKQWKLFSNGSYLTTDNTTIESNFLRFYSNSTFDLKKKWIGAKFSTENNEETEKQTKQLTNLSQKFVEYEASFGIGDSLNVFSEIGYRNRMTDSLHLQKLERVQNGETYFLKSQLINSKTSNLKLFVNYRKVNNVFIENEQSLNSRISYRQVFWKQLVTTNTIYETLSGTLPEQEFTYVEVEAGQGFYTWIDYNGNGIKELNEFEVAQFPDQATYLRVNLPSLKYLKTNQVKFSQSLQLNFSRWRQKSGIRKLLSHFHNQSFILIDNKREREGEQFHFNPFAIDEEDLLGLNFSFRNSLFFHRGQRNYSTTYNFTKSENKIFLSIDDVQNTITQHQIQFQHALTKFWVLDILGTLSENENHSRNFANRDYLIKTENIKPTISYVLNRNSHLDFSYEFQDKQNQIGEQEQLEQQNLGFSFAFSKATKYTVTGNFNYILNAYDGNNNTPVAYQILEGLQPGKNFTWGAIIQKKLTSYLDLNINYLGRKSEENKAIHTGTVQLRANF